MLPSIAGFQSWWGRLQADEEGLVDRVPAHRLAGAVILASALALFAELVMIRWHATSAHVFAIFKNISMLSCFLGLGIGFALSSRKGLRTSNWSWLHAVGGNLFLVGIFALNAVMFIPLGYLTGGLMSRLPALEA